MLKSHRASRVSGILLRRVLRTQDGLAARHKDGLRQNLVALYTLSLDQPPKLLLYRGLSP